MINNNYVGCIKQTLENHCVEMQGGQSAAWPPFLIVEKLWAQPEDDLCPPYILQKQIRI